MQATLFLSDVKKPVAELDEVTVMEYNDNHKEAPLRIYYKSRSLNSSKVMLEMRRDEEMLLKFADGRSANVLLQHTSMDSEGNAVGVFRVLGALKQ